MSGNPASLNHSVTPRFSQRYQNKICGQKIFLIDLALARLNMNDSIMILESESEQESTVSVKLVPITLIFGRVASAKC